MSSDDSQSLLTDYLVILCGCPDEAIAAQLAAALVGERLAACVNRLSGIRSTYHWKGELQDEPEVLLLIKTTTQLYPAVELRLRALHPFELPEIIALPVVRGSDPYLAWLGAGCRALNPDDSRNIPT